MITTNNAGGQAFQLTAEEALVKFATTGIANYKASNFNVKEFIALCDQVSGHFLLQLLSYSKEYGAMRDMPVLITAYLATKGTLEEFQNAFRTSITSLKMLSKFVHFMRSGDVRKSLGNRAKKAVQGFILSQTPESLYYTSVGFKPSLKDMIKLSHVRAPTPEYDMLFKYLLGFKGATVPLYALAYERFCKQPTAELPNAPLERLLPFVSTREQWESLFDRLSWNQLRLNLNNINKAGALEPNIDYIYGRLTEFTKIPKHVWSFNIMNAQASLNFSNRKLDEAFDAIFEYLRTRVFELSEDTVIFVDTSGSMKWRVGDSNYISNNPMTYFKVGTYFASALFAKQPTKVNIFGVDTQVHNFNILPTDSFKQVTTKIDCTGGGTALGKAIDFLLTKKLSYSNVIVISDNESWRDGSRSMSKLWPRYLEENPESKLILWDIQPSSNSQMVDSIPNVRTVSGFSDVVFGLIKLYAENPTSKTLLDIIKEIKV